MTEPTDEGWKKWRGLIATAVIAGALFGASRIDALRAYEAMFVAMAFPVAVLVGGLLPLREATRALQVIAVTVALLAVGAAEVELSEVFFPGDPIATTTVSRDAPDARIAWPADGRRSLDLQVRGRLAAADGVGQGTYALVLSRGGEDINVAGRLSRTVTQGRSSRRGAPSKTVSTHLTDQHEITLPGSGPVRVRLDAIEGGVAPSVRLTVREPPRFDRWIIAVLAVLVLAGAVIEAVAARAGYRARLTGALGASAVLAYYVVHRFDPDDPLLTVAGGLIVAVVVGGLGGILIGKIAAMLAARRPAPALAKDAALAAGPKERRRARPEG